MLLSIVLGSKPHQQLRNQPLNINPWSRDSLQKVIVNDLSIFLYSTLSGEIDDIQRCPTGENGLSKV